jgi:hypothetical protein
LLAATREPSWSRPSSARVVSTWAGSLRQDSVGNYSKRPLTSHAPGRCESHDVTGESGLQVRLIASESTSTLFYPGLRSTPSHTFAARFPIPEFAGVSSFRSCWRESKASYADFKDYFARLSKYATSGSQVFVGLDSARSIASSSSRKLPIMLQGNFRSPANKSRRMTCDFSEDLSLRPRLHGFHPGVEGKSVSVPLNPCRPQRRTAFARRGGLRAWSGELGFTSHSD